MLWSRCATNATDIIQLPTIDSIQDLEYDMECDMECAIQYATMSVNNGKWGNQITAQRILLNIKLMDHA